MVITLAPSACSARMVQLLTELPSMSTTQAPHWLVSQPTCVPVRPRFSRRNCTRSVRASTVAVAALPFTVMVTEGMDFSPFVSVSYHCRAPAYRRARRAAAKAIDPASFVRRTRRVKPLGNGPSAAAAARHDVEEDGDEEGEPDRPDRGRQPRRRLRPHGRHRRCSARRCRNRRGGRRRLRYRRRLRRGGAVAATGTPVTAAHRVAEAREKFLGHLARGGIDQARADLGELAADMRLDG